MNGLVQLRRVMKNLAATAAGQALSTILNFLAVVTVARHLGVEGYGQYAYVLAVVGVFQLFAMAGIGHIVTREVAVQPGRGPRIVGAAHSLVSLLSLGVFAIIVAIVQVGDLSPELQWSMYLAAVGVIAAMHAMVLGGFFRALEEMEVTSIGLVVQKAALLGFVVVAITLNPGLLGMCAAFALASGCLWLYYFAMVVWRHFWPRPCVDLRLWRALLRDGVPLGTAAILRKMSGRVDVLILAVLGTHGAAGHFAASYKVIEAFGIVATTLTQVLFPLLSRSARSEAMFQGVVAIGVRYLFALGLPVAIVLAASAERIVTLVYGPSFAPASTALAVMSLSCATVFVTSLYPFIFAALHAQRPYIAAATAGLLVNVLVDVALVPGFGHVGASLGTVSAEVTFLALGALFLKRRMPTLAIARLSWRPLAAALPMAGVVLLASRYSDGTFAAGLAGATAVYVVLLIVLGAIRPGELATIRRELGYRSRRPTPPGVSTDVRERSSHRPGLDPDRHPAIVGPPAPLAASDLRLRETV